jgi:hypothetical protein
MAAHSSRFQHQTSKAHLDVHQRTWQEIVEEASRERDPERLQLLSEELERVLEERSKKLHAQSQQQDPNQHLFRHE